MQLPELVCPAGNLPALKAAVDHGADCVYLGLNNDTNARHFAGLNFDAASAREGLRYARQRGVKVLLAINTASAQGWRRPLLAWLQLQLQRAEAAGDSAEAARIRRRIALAGR